MTWKDRTALKESLGPDELVAIRAVYPFSLILTNCILPSTYTPPAELAQLVAFTSKGQEAANGLRSQNGLRNNEIAAVVLATFAHHDLLVDVLRSDVAGLRELFHNEVREKRIRFPFVFGRLLYDRFFDMYGGGPQELTQEETQRFLKGTPQGVFQIDDLVIGPLGILRSTASRDDLPTTRAPLAHCLDPGCERLHSVKLRTSVTKIGAAYRSLAEGLGDTYGPPSRWGALAGHLWDDGAYYTDFNSSDLWLLIGNAFSTAELRILLSGVLTDHAAAIRTQLELVSGSNLRGSPRDIASGLDTGECLQLLLLATDIQLVESLEKLIDNDDIRIPVTEVRESPFMQSMSGGWMVQKAECSRFGVRFVGGQRDLSVPRLKALLKRAHGSAERLTDLEWQLLDVPGDDVHTKLERLTHETAPEEITRRFLVARPQLFEETKSYLTYGRFASPTTTAERENMVNRILWKLGFQVPARPDTHEKFWRRLEGLRSAIGSGDLSTDTRLEEVRAAGVNFFVSLEELLDSSLAFVLWALLSDHYSIGRPGRFVFRLRVARVLMAARLDGWDLGGGETLAMSPSGENSLYALIEGFRAASKMFQDILDDGNRPDFKRVPEQYPAFAGKSAVELFPFQHILPILDLDPSAASSIVDLLADTHRLLSKGGVAAVRNRIPHGGREFPSLEEFSSALRACEQAMLALEEFGATPLVWTPHGNRADQYGRAQSELVDFRGRAFVLYQPTELRTSGLPVANDDQVIFRAARLRNSSEVLRFRFQEDSEYTRIWDNYPQRPPVSVRETPDVTVTVEEMDRDVHLKSKKDSG